MKTKIRGIGVLAFLLVAALAVLIFLPPVSQDPRYHDFADQRAVWGIPNFWNVASNALFLVAALCGARAFRSRDSFSQNWERGAYAIVLAGTALVFIGSGYYHWRPDNTTLFWDRLPMTLVFMSLFATTVGERLNMSAGRILLLPLLALGVFSVIYWRGSGDLRLYGLVQFYPMVAIPLLLLLLPPRYTASGWMFATLGFYGLAKVFELLDRPLGAIVSTGGHPWKHVAATAALFCYTEMIARRCPMVCGSPSPTDSRSSA